MKREFRLLRYARPHGVDVAIVVATMLASVALDVLRPWPLKLLVDQILTARSVPAWLAGAAGRFGDPLTGALAWICLASVAIFIGEALASTAQAAVSVRLGQRMVYELGADLFLHLQRLSLRFHRGRATGDMIERVTGDPYCVQEIVTGALLPFAQSVVMLAAMFVVMVRLDGTLTLLALGAVPLLLLAVRLFGGPMRERHRERRDREAQLMSVVEQTLSAIPAVQAFTREEAEHARFRGHARDTVAAYQRATAADMAFKFGVGLVTATGTAALMFLAARYVLEGRATVGTMLVFLFYLSALYGPLNDLAQTVSTWQYAAAKAERVLEVLDTAPDVRDAPAAIDARLAGHVRYENVWFGYRPGQPVLHGVSLEARPGQVVAVVGATGAGKTTLINLLPRFFDPAEGRITIDGHDLRALRVRGLRQQIALVLQESFLFPFSVADNIAYGRPDATDEEIVAAARLANADEFIRRLPDGYRTVLGDRAATLSGGERQRLAIARAFLKDAPILVLDEPTSALDARTEALLLDSLGRLMAGRTTFVIAHRLSTIRGADAILVLDRGQIVEQGTHDGLLAAGGVYAGLYRTQAELAPLPGES